MSARALLRSSCTIGVVIAAFSCSCGSSSAASGAAGSVALPSSGSGAPLAGAGAVTGPSAAAPKPVAAGTNGSAHNGLQGAAGHAGNAAPAAGTPATAGSAAGGGAGASGSAAAPVAANCDRACLIAILQNYLDALIAKDPSKLPVASPLKYTENGVEAKLGETLWKTASELVPDARLDFADPVEGQVATQLVVHENGTTPVLYMVRLKVVARQITEIEAMAVRRQGAANGFFNAMNLVPAPVFLQTIEPAQRMSRDALEALTQEYLDYLEGKKRGSDLPFDMGCKRYENGQATASGVSSFNAQSWSFDVTRRILVIDEEAGITWGMFPFSQAASALVVGEAFKLIDGKIMMIQAVMANMPAKAWD